jgi:hypothetical protein
VPIALLIPWLAFGLAFAITQYRFHDAYVERYCGPNRWERGKMYLRHPLQYLRLLRKPPFTLGSMFRRLDDPVVERRRSQYLLAGIATFAYLPALFVGLIIYGALFVW